MVTGTVLSGSADYHTVKHTHRIFVNLHILLTHGARKWEDLLTTHLGSEPVKRVGVSKASWVKVEV